MTYGAKRYGHTLLEWIDTLKPIGTVTKYYPFLDDEVKNILDSIMVRAENYYDFVNLLGNIVLEEDVPVHLAGGLRAENVAGGIRTVAPFAVDVCSGVRTDGKLDEIKLDAFFRSVNQTQ